MKLSFFAPLFVGLLPNAPHVDRDIQCSLVVYGRGQAIEVGILPGEKRVVCVVQQRPSDRRDDAGFRP